MALQETTRLPTKLSIPATRIFVCLSLPVLVSSYTSQKILAAVSVKQPEESLIKYLNRNLFYDLLVCIVNSSIYKGLAYLQLG